MAIEGKHVQVNHRLDNKKKKAIALLLPLRFPDTQTDGKHFKKALNKGLHDVSVHIQLKFNFSREISLHQTCGMLASVQKSVNNWKPDLAKKYINI